MIKVLVLLSIFSCSSQEQVQVKKVDKAYMQEHVLQTEAQLVDVRSKAEYAKGHIGHALNFNVLEKTAFLEQIKVLDKGKPVYLYCKAGGRSNRAAKILKQNGFTQIFDYAGGYDNWVSQ